VHLKPSTQRQPIKQRDKGESERLSSFNPSFDLSLAPSVVGALSPTIGASFQLAGFALCTVEGSGSPNPSSQASVLSKKNAKL